MLTLLIWIMAIISFMCVWGIGAPEGSDEVSLVMGQLLGFDYTNIILIIIVISALVVYFNISNRTSAAKWGLIICIIHLVISFTPVPFVVGMAISFSKEEKRQQQLVETEGTSSQPLEGTGYSFENVDFEIEKDRNGNNVIIIDAELINTSTEYIWNRERALVIKADLGDKSGIADPVYCCQILTKNITPGDSVHINWKQQYPEEMYGNEKPKKLVLLATDVAKEEVGPTLKVVESEDDIDGYYYCKLGYVDEWFIELNKNCVLVHRGSNVVYIHQIGCYEKTADGVEISFFADYPSFHGTFSEDGKEMTLVPSNSNYETMCCEKVDPDTYKRMFSEAFYDKDIHFLEKY